MDDRETVLKCLEYCSQGAKSPYEPEGRNCADCVYPKENERDIPCTKALIRDALALLKEQDLRPTEMSVTEDQKVEFIESYIKTKGGDYKWNDNHGELIRCRDCIHSSPWYRDKRRCFFWTETGVSVFNDGYCNYGRKEQKGGEKDG